MNTSMASYARSSPAAAASWIVRMSLLVHANNRIQEFQHAT